MLLYSILACRLQYRRLAHCIMAMMARAMMMTRIVITYDGEGGDDGAS